MRGKAPLVSEQNAVRGNRAQKNSRRKPRTALPKGRDDKAQCWNTGLVNFARSMEMSRLFLASWETVPQISINWSGDIHVDGLALVLVVMLWAFRMRR